MATTTPFAYNTGTTISGTIQVGQIAVGTTSQEYSTNIGGVQWWMGPDQNLGYVITVPVSGNTQPTPLTTNEIFLNPFYKGADIVLSNNNQTAHQNFGYQQSVLGATSIGATDRVMFSVLCELSAPSTLPDSHFIGVGYTSMNYSGSPYGGYPGNDAQSMGYRSDGTIWYNGNQYDSGFETWTNNDIIDIVVDNNLNSMWVRVNGGYWNNNPTADPAAPSGGFETIGGPFFPVLCPAYEGTMTIQNTSTYGIPNGYTFLGGTFASLGFFRTDSPTDEQFIALAEYVSNEYGTPQVFTGATQASSWLTLNGYWNSYGWGNTIGPYYLQYSYTDAYQDGWMTFPNHIGGTWNSDPNLVGETGFAIYINKNDDNAVDNTSVLSGLTTNSGYLRLTQNSDTAVYSFISPNGFTNDGYSGNEYYWDNGYGPSSAGTLTLVSSATTNFNNVDPIYITVSYNQSFTISPSDFTNYGYGYGVINQSNNGFEITGSHGSGEAFFGPNLSVPAGGSSVKSSEILNFWNNNGLTVGNNAYLFYVNWGAGSTIGTSIVVISYYYSDENNAYINIGLVDTTIPGWDTPGTNMYSTLRAVDGTFNFPATFSLYNPEVQDNDSWC